MCSLYNIGVSSVLMIHHLYVFHIYKTLNQYDMTTSKKIVTHLYAFYIQTLCRKRIIYFEKKIFLLKIVVTDIYFFDLIEVFYLQLERNHLLENDIVSNLYHHHIMFILWYVITFDNFISLDKKVRNCKVLIMQWWEK